jgi:hypothetical protein
MRALPSSVWYSRRATRASTSAEQLSVPSGRALRKLSMSCRMWSLVAGVMGSCGGLRETSEDASMWRGSSSSEQPATWCYFHDFILRSTSQGLLVLAEKMQSRGCKVSIPSASTHLDRHCLEDEIACACSEDPNYCRQHAARCVGHPCYWHTHSALEDRRVAYLGGAHAPS